MIRALAWGRFPDTADGDHNIYRESESRIAGLEPGKPRTLVFMDNKRKTGAVLSLPADRSKDPAELTVKLLPNAIVSGRLVDAVGKAVTGGVHVRLRPAAPSFFREINIADVKLDSEGRFRCETLPAGGPYVLRATNRLVYGFGPKMEPEKFPQFELTHELRVEPGQVVALGTFDVTTAKRIEAPAGQVRPADVPITGRIVDLEGKPIAGVAVKLDSVQGATSGDLTPWIEALKRGEPPWIAYKHIERSVDIAKNVLREAITDKDGRFRFDGLGAEHVVGLTIQGETVAYTSLEVVTRKTEPIAARGFPDTYGPGSQTVYGAEFTLTARPGRLIEGVVRDARSKQPLAGVGVESWRFAGSDFVSIRQLKTVTDESGRFRLVGMPKGTGNLVIAIPNDDQPYFMREAAIDDPQGIAPLHVEIELHRGIMITGKITDKATGKPVPDVRLHYLPFLENAYVQALPEFDRNGNTNGFQTRYTTRADGTYRLVGMPGRAIVGVESVGKTPYRSGVGSDTIKGLDKNGFFKTWGNPIPASKFWPQTLVEINPPEGTESLTVNAQA